MSIILDFIEFGRNIYKDGVIYLGYSASGISFLTDAQNVMVEARGIKESDSMNQNGFLGVYIDDVISEKVKINNKKMSFSVNVDAQKNKCKKVEILKLTESQYDKVGISGLYIDGEFVKVETLLQENNRNTNRNDDSNRILFIGDSLTAGYGVLGNPNDMVFKTDDEDVTLAYAYLAAKELNADYQILASSGDGIISRWVDSSNGMPQMPNMFDLWPQIFPYQEVSLARRLGFGEDEYKKFEPTSFVPRYIVCNLGTNDESYICGNLDREKEFVKVYSKFLRDMYTYWPDVIIIVAYGLMSGKLTDAIRKIVKKLQKEKNIHFLEFDIMKPEDGYGFANHPTIVSQKKAAKKLVNMIGKFENDEECRIF